MTLEQFLTAALVYASLVTFGVAFVRGLPRRLVSDERKRRKPIACDLCMTFWVSVTLLLLALVVSRGQQWILMIGIALTAAGFSYVMTSLVRWHPPDPGPLGLGVFVSSRATPAEAQHDGKTAAYRAGERIADAIGAQHTGKATTQTVLQTIVTEVTKACQPTVPVSRIWLRGNRNSTQVLAEIDGQWHEVVAVPDSDVPNHCVHYGSLRDARVVPEDEL